MSGLDAAAAGIAGLAARATLLLCLSLLVSWLARRGSARTLHLLWTTTFVALLALPALSLLGPSWSVPVLPSRDEPVRLHHETTGEGTLSESSPRDMAGPAVSPGSVLRTADRAPSPRSGSGRAAGSLTGKSTPPASGTGDVPVPLTPSAIAFLIWALGCGAALTSLGVGGLRFRKLVQDAAPVRDPSWLQQADAIRWRLRVRSQVRILMSPQVTTPMAGGPWRPVILLPPSAEAWPPERRAVVLAHELIHVRRRDALRQVVGRAVVALYWFHPLNWLAWRAATIAAERSCDEEVLELGTRPSEYARHLFSLASGTAGGRAVLALPMVQRSQLENRIMSILKRHRPRYSLAGTIAALAGIGVAGTLIACANPVPRNPDAQPATREEAIASGEGQAQEGAIAAPSPEAARLENAEAEPLIAASAMPEPTPAATDVSALPLEAAYAPDPQPAAPEVAQDSIHEVAQDSIHQAVNCNLSVIRDSESTTLRTFVEGIQLCMRTHGNVVMTENGTAVEGMDASSWLLLQSRDEKTHRMVITSGPDGLEYDWSIDGLPQPFDVEAEEWRDLMFTVVARSSEAEQIRAREAVLRGRIASHRGWVATLQGRIASHRWQVATLQSQIAALRAHVAGLVAQMVSTRVRAIRMQQPLAAVWQAAERVYRVDQIDVRDAMQSLEDVDWSQAFGRAGQVPEAMAVREALNALSQNVQRLRESLDTLDEVFRDSRQRVEDDLEVRLAELAEEIEEYDLAGRVAALESQIAGYDLDGKIAEIETQIEKYDLDGKIREIEAQIEELDADRRADEIERSIQDEIAALRSLIG